MVVNRSRIMRREEDQKLKTWVSVSALPPIGCGTLDKAFPFSGLQLFPTADDFYGAFEFQKAILNQYRRTTQFFCFVFAFLLQRE